MGKGNPGIASQSPKSVSLQEAHRGPLRPLTPFPVSYHAQAPNDAPQARQKGRFFCVYQIKYD
jgi:hypothetical protein